MKLLWLDALCVTGCPDAASSPRGAELYLRVHDFFHRLLHWRVTYLHNGGVIDAPSGESRREHAYGTNHPKNPGDDPHSCPRSSAQPPHPPGSAALTWDGRGSFRLLYPEKQHDPGRPGFCFSVGNMRPCIPASLHPCIPPSHIPASLHP